MYTISFWIWRVCNGERHICVTWPSSIQWLSASRVHSTRFRAARRGERHFTTPILFIHRRYLYVAIPFPRIEKQWNEWWVSEKGIFEWKLLKAAAPGQSPCRIFWCGCCVSERQTLQWLLFSSGHYNFCVIRHLSRTTGGIPECVVDLIICDRERLCDVMTADNKLVGGC